MKSHYTCAELAALQLPGKPATRQGWDLLVTKSNWSFVESKSAGRSGVKRAYQPSKEVTSLIQSKLMETTINVPATQTTAVAAPVKTTDLKDWQRATAEARAAICAEVKRLAAFGGTDKAIKKVIALAAAGDLPPHLQDLVEVANAKPGLARTLSRTSIYRWMKDAEGGLGKLAPKDREKTNIPAWAPILIKLMANPQKPALTDCMAKLPTLLPSGVPMPSYFAANRFIKKMGKVEAQRGRMGSLELKNIRPFIRRDSSQMWPGDAYTADGHTFDAEIAHRDHGRPFRPEITTVLDIATRKAVGWSVDLAESTWSVLAALRHACTSSGIPAIFYVDNGSGFKNVLMSHEATGFMARLGITLTHSTPYNSQARGIIERSHQTIWVRAAKLLPTYMGAPMDPQAKKAVFKLTRADVKQTGVSRALMPWADFIRFCEMQVEEYNNKPHRALPTIKDPITGNKRHQSPNEAWATAVEDGKAAGWAPVEVEASEADDLFRPYEECLVTRGEIRLHKNTYFSPLLEEWHDETVRVGFDIHDASRVWVRNQSGQLICVAEFEANKRSYFPESFIQQAAAKRAQGRIDRAQARIDEAQEELDAPMLIEHQPSIEIPVMTINQAEPIAAALPANVIELPKAKAARPMFDTDAAKYRWLIGNADQMTSVDEAWINYYRLTAEWEDIFGDLEVAAR